ncbi:MAG: hypothetical protein PHW56_08970, partial [Methanosarcinaceae archaeon]|nr:hypothetical protein [Methanosarcinaceae archaeon]
MKVLTFMPKNQIACGHPALKDGVCFGPPARFPGYSEIIGSIAEISFINAIEPLLSVIFGE